MQVNPDVVAAANAAQTPHIALPAADNTRSIAVADVVLHSTVAANGDAKSDVAAADACFLPGQAGQISTLSVTARLGSGETLSYQLASLTVDPYVGRKTRDGWSVKTPAIYRDRAATESVEAASAAGAAATAAAVPPPMWYLLSMGHMHDFRNRWVLETDMPTAMAAAKL